MAGEGIDPVDFERGRALLNSALDEALFGATEQADGVIALRGNLIHAGELLYECVNSAVPLPDDLRRRTFLALSTAHAVRRSVVAAIGEALDESDESLYVISPGEVDTRPET